MSPLHRSTLLLLLTMTIWGSTFVVTKEVIAELPPFALAFGRVAVGALVLTPFALLRYPRGSGLPWRTFVLISFVGVVFYYVAFNLSLQYTSAVQGALVQSSIPAATALVAVLWLREEASAVRWLGIALSIAGVLIVFSGGDSNGTSNALLGNALMFATVLAWGVYTSMAKRVASIDAMVTTAAIMAIGAGMLAPIAAYELRDAGWPDLSLKAWAGLVYLGAGASGFAYVMYNDALKHMDASQAGAYTNLIPVVGVITGIVVLSEPLTLRALIGGAIVMLGMWVAGKGNGRSAAQRDAQMTSSSGKTPRIDGEDDVVIGEDAPRRGRQRAVGGDDH